MALDTRTSCRSSEPSIPDKHDIGHIEANDDAGETEDPIEAKRVIRKIDLRLIPLLMLLYTLTFLDRVNIGNARLWNLEKDLGMSGYDYNIVVLGMSSSLLIHFVPSTPLENSSRTRTT